MPRILVVEDEPANVEILLRLLTRKGYTVLTASTKEETVAVATAQRPDLILMDIGIPDAVGEEVNRYGGVEAAQLLRAAEPTKLIPIIAITASAMLDEKKRFLEAGCNAVLPKPFEFGPLLEAIDSRLVVGQEP
jgi:two-component system, cell cycle response regulator DivK